MVCVREGTSCERVTYAAYAAVYTYVYRYIYINGGGVFLDI